MGFELKYDLMLDDTFDLQLDASGDLIIDDAQLQHQRLIIMANKGNFRNHIEVGVGITEYLLDEGDLVDLQHEIQSQFELDGNRIDYMAIPNINNMQIVAVKVK